ncbi:TRAP transporter large permease [Flammeovirga kamogawensis]|uniref:TRAP transporter large permease subunit n=1 Tax=Flammeovirga kamogawensis TaxID=373891 RepID=A0ABX8GXT9_9BACT|nr:TRAP transporter large permease subunit [Flammeovirga kamogawensis]MBB6462815.1 tripartite ATP-independent transporter DctM subunit [Flammeovirga kamogawensis]QWG08400.1 TRAP transporter large permease subunit [Flammeovirga kamogawensis]TRX66695.1 TRAP transporter large permease subunit [Flammeovirga kamogawensis]
MVLLLLFLCLFAALLLGYPVAFTLAGVSLIFGYYTFGLDLFYLLPLRIFGTMSNQILIAVPLFVYMGVMLEKSGIASRLLNTMAIILGKVKGGLAISVALVGAMLAASTGIVGATVVTMGLMSLPSMLKRGYTPEYATGIIAASGTLGQIIPPSIVLILMGSVMNISIGELFIAAVVPGVLLVICYIFYVYIYAVIYPDDVPPIPDEEIAAFKKDLTFSLLVRTFVLPFLLILSVLGSIFLGIASPTEAAGVGAMAATLLTALEGKLTWKAVKESAFESGNLTSMVFMILVGATAFGLVFRGLGGDDLLVELIQSADLEPYTFLALVMIGIFIAGFFIDFIEIIFIFMPVVTPIFEMYGLNTLWIAILVSLNLQTSFLTPPFGFSLFYLKGVAPKEIKTKQIYKGIVPYIGIQILLITGIIFFPEIVTWLPNFLD